MAFPESFLQELKLRNDITELVSSYITLKRRGRNMVGLCPFHGEKTPSFNIYTENGSFYCFGCGVGGDVITFVMKMENLDYVDAVKFLAQRAGMDMPEDSYDDSMSKLRTRVYEANREAARYYYKMLYSPDGKHGLDYFHGRMLTDRTIRHFGLGFADDDWSSLSDYLIGKGFSKNELVAANLAVKQKNGNGIYDRFRNRVMFPIIDLRGNVIAFGGRIMTDEKPKYLNTSDTPVFKKSENLFSLNSCTEDVRKLGKIPSKKTVFSIKVAADEKRSRELNVTKGDLLYSFGRITYADDEPINYTINYIPEKLFPGLDVYDLEQNSLYKILESHYDVQINRGKRTVEAVIAGPEIAGYLGINPDMPVILFVATITGTINGKEKPIEYFRCYYRTDHYKFYIEQVK